MIKREEKKEERKVQKEVIQEKKEIRKEEHVEIRALKEKCRADITNAAEADKEAVKAACEIAIKEKQAAIIAEKKEEKVIRKVVTETVKDAKKEVKKVIKDTRKENRTELKTLKIECSAEISAAKEADKEAIKKACVTEIKAKRVELRANIKEMRATEYADVKAKIDAYIATLSEEEKAKYIKNFTKRYQRLIERAEEKGQDIIVVTLEATKEAIEQE